VLDACSSSSRRVAMSSTTVADQLRSRRSARLRFWECLAGWLEPAGRCQRRWS
jgi:hypothetical protein